MGGRGDILTKDSLKVLELLKKAQGTEDNTVYLNADELFARTVIEAGQPYVSVDLSEYSDRLNSILLSLSDEGYIRKLFVDFEYLQVTHEGWHYLSQLKKMRKKQAQNESKEAFDRKLNIFNALVPFITFILGALLDHFTGIIDWFSSLF